MRGSLPAAGWVANAAVNATNARHAGRVPHKATRDGHEQLWGSRLARTCRRDACTTMQPRVAMSICGAAVRLPGVGVAAVPAARAGGTPAPQRNKKPARIGRVGTQNSRLRTENSEVSSPLARFGSTDDCRRDESFAAPCRFRERALRPCGPGERRFARRPGSPDGPRVWRCSRIRRWCGG